MFEKRDFFIFIPLQIFLERFCYDLESDYFAFLAYLVYFAFFAYFAYFTYFAFFAVLA